MSVTTVGRLAVGVLGLGVLASCASETLFKSDFNPTAVNQPPAVTQAVGTAHVHGPAGNVVVVAAPVTPPSDKWVKISRPNADSDVAGMQGKLSQFKGDSHYTFSTTMFMPSGAGLATIQFEAFTNPVSSLTNFLHIDLMQDNTVRIDDNDASKFGSFPRNQAFVVLVGLDINATPKAHISLAGAGTSGSADYTIPGPMISLARQFGAVRLWMGFPWLGSFSASNIVVTRQTD